MRIDTHHYSPASSGTHAEKPVVRADESSRRRSPFDLIGKRVLLASDGSAESTAATFVSLALANRHLALVHVVSVIDTRSAPLPPPLDLALAIGDASVGQTVHAEQEEAVRAGIASSTGQRVEWPVRIALGTPASAIAHEAERIGADLIVLGLRRHGRLDRVVHDETALNVMRTARCPVLGVVAETKKLPARVLAAMDFSPASVDAARVAHGVMAAGGTEILAYVPPMIDFLPGDGESVIRELGVNAGFSQAARELKREGMRVEHLVLHREQTRPVATLLLEYAGASHIDLIAAGSARHGRLDRWMLGSVSTDLVRDGRRSVLVVPAGHVG